LLKDGPDSSRMTVQGSHLPNGNYRIILENCSDCFADQELNIPDPDPDLHTVQYIFQIILKTVSYYIQDK
jgi:hypothetical protein